jgi:hypothetical protein
MITVLFSAEKNIFFLLTHPVQLWDQPTPLSTSLEGDANRAPEVKDVHNSTPTPPVCPEGMILNTNNF